MLLYLQVVINTTHSWTMASMVLMAMDPVDEDLVLDTEDEAIFLANMGVARQAVHGLIDVIVGGGVVHTVNEEGCTHRLKARASQIKPGLYLNNQTLARTLHLVGSHGYDPRRLHCLLALLACTVFLGRQQEEALFATDALP